MTESIDLESSGLRARVSTLGAELTSLRLMDESELLWQGDPAIWAKQSPILFPLVGRLKNDRMVHEGKTYEMGIHGFAAGMEFTVANQSETHVRLTLVDSEATRAQYPFPFELALDYRLRPTALEMEGTVRNTGEGVLPCSFGFHPGFNWPLTPGRAREDYRMRFDEEEVAEVNRPTPEGLFGGSTEPSPVKNRVMPLNDALFEKLAIVFDQHKSRGLTYGAPGEVGLRCEFPSFPHLGVWTKPGNPFVCVEPWQGHGDPVGFDGPFVEKPGLVHIPAGETRHWRMRISMERITE